MLALLVGIFGVHNFVAGYNREGIIQLLVTILSFGLLSVFVIMHNMYEIVTITHDADGNPFM
jgi:TM2 domain-containing membrane protein YozV